MKSSRQAILAILLCVIVPAMARAAGDLRRQSRGVVKLYVTSQPWNLNQPWTKARLRQASCSGFFIEQGILTNAHCVADAAFIQAELQGQADKAVAEVVEVNHQIDLALLRLQDPERSRDIPRIRLGTLPNHRDRVVTVGYPSGGQQVSYTEGVVSRIDVMAYAHSNLPSLLVQTDAAINPGNSGGPVFAADGTCIGVATQKNMFAEGQGFFVPTPMIRQFLRDIEDGDVDGIPNLGIALQNLENDALRAWLGLKPGQTGVRVAAIAAGSSADGLLRVDDVLLEIEGAQIYSDGRVPFTNGTRIGLGVHVFPRNVGDTIRLRISRGGREQRLKLRLKPYRFSVIPHMPRFDQPPDYVLYGGLVFQAAEPRLIGTPYRKNFPGALLPYWSMPVGTDGLEEVVVISTIFDAAVNRGYGRGLRMVPVTAVNEQSIHSLTDLKRALEVEPQGRWIVIDIDNQQRIVLDRQAVAAQDAMIRRIYNIPPAP